jgi:arylsulfatase A-like enzyme
VADKKWWSPLACALAAAWVLLGCARGAGTIAVNGYLAQAMQNLALLEVWNGFLQPAFVRRSTVALFSAIALAAVVRVAARRLGFARAGDVVATTSALATFWVCAALTEVTDRTPIRDVMTSSLVLSEAHAGILAIAAAGFALSLALWFAFRRADGRFELAVTAGLFAVVIALLASTRFGVTDAAANQVRPNIVIITIDALRADHLSSYGYPRKTSPRIDAFAASSTLYENSISQASSTHPSMAAMLTSNLPIEFTGHPFKYVPYSLSTVAESLRNAGYETGAVVSNVWLRSSLGFDQGFAEYDERSAMAEFYGDTDRINWKNAAQVSDGGVAFLDRHKSDRFFLWLHYLDPHHPYDPQPPFDEKFAQKRKDHQDLIAQLRSLPTDKQTELLSKLGKREIPMPDDTFQAVIDQYDGEIAYTDVQVGRVFDALDELGLSDNTVVVLTADHGEEFREHGDWGHGITLFKEVVHVPLIVHTPRQTAGQRVKQVVRTIDIAPTMLTLAGVSVPETMRGEDLTRAAARADASAVSVCPRVGLSSIQTDTWKLIRAKDGRASLYDLTADPNEHDDVAEEQPAIAKDLLARLHQSVGVPGHGYGDERITGVDPATRQQLEALGYLH